MDNLDASRLIISGDLNVALGPLDYHGSRLTHSNVNSCKALLSLMEEFNLIDVWRNEHPTLRAYTKHQKNPPALSRLDYILVSSNLANNVNPKRDGLFGPISQPGDGFRPPPPRSRKPIDKTSSVWY